LKAFCLAFAFLLAALPARAEELPQTSNAWRASEPDLAEPGKFQWTVIDDAAGGAQASAAATNQPNLDRSAPARAALAQIRAETQRVLAEAQKASTKVTRIRYDLRVQCVVEQVQAAPDALAEVATPYIWGEAEKADPVDGTLELCEVDYSQKVRSMPQDDTPSQAQAQPQPTAKPQMVDYKVAFPVD
jgi:hypothetical protein